MKQSLKSIKFFIIDVLSDPIKISKNNSEITGNIAFLGLYYNNSKYKKYYDGLLDRIDFTSEINSLANYNVSRTPILDSINLNPLDAIDEEIIDERIRYPSEWLYDNSSRSRIRYSRSPFIDIATVRTPADEYIFRRVIVEVDKVTGNLSFEFRKKYMPKFFVIDMMKEN